MPEVDKYKEVPAIQQQFPVEVPTSAHQPIAIVIDVSGSMFATEAGESKSNIKLAEEMVNKIGLDPGMKEEYKKTADFLVMTFADNVITQQDWIPLSRFKRDIKLSASGCTAFHNAVIQAINATRTRRNSYKTVDGGIRCKRPQIFLFTDGGSTDPEKAAEAQEMCRKYIDTKKAELHVILLPGSNSKETKALSPNVKIYKVEDCTHGLPAAEKFINASIVAFSSSSIGEDVNLPLPKDIKTTANNATVDSQGNRTVNDTVDDADDTWI